MNKEELQELLIRMDQKLEDMAPRVGNIEDALCKQGDLCRARMVDCNKLFERRVPYGMFKWIVGILITCFIGMGISTTSMTVDIKDIQHDVSKIEKNIEYYHPMPSQNIRD